MPFPLLLLLLVGGAAVVAASSKSEGEGEAPDLDAQGLKLNRIPLTLEQRFAANQRRSDAERAEREKQARKELDDWYAGAESIPVFGEYFKLLRGTFKSWMNSAINIGNSIARWNAPDWNSDAEKARTKSALDRFAALSLAPPTPLPDDRFATYADSLEGVIGRAEDMFSKRPDRLKFWQALTGWIKANPQYGPVLDVLHTWAPGYGYVWPPRADLRSTPGRVDRNASILAIASLAASMRGKDPAQVRAATIRGVEDMLRRQPELRFADNSGWFLGGVLDVIDAATK